MKKRYLSILLILALCLGLTVAALASEETAEDLGEEPMSEEETLPSLLPPDIDGEQSGGYKYSVYYGEATITGYSGSGGSITIPSEIDGYPVTSIGYEAFFHCTSLTSVIIPDSVKKIEAHAFWMCSSLVSVSIPYGVENIGSWMFWDCTSLTTVNIPDSVRSIDWEAFKGCTSLERISIPNSVTSIAAGAFYDCKNLETVNIPDSVTSIGSEAFKGCKSLTAITIANGVKEIEKDTFYECTSLKEITIPKSVTQISEGAFWNDSSLIDIYFGGSETDWNSVLKGDHNDPLTTANIHYGSVTPATPTPPSGGAGDISESAYKVYLKEWIRYEESVNDTLTTEMAEQEFIPLIEAGDYTTFPAEMMFSGMLVSGKAMTYDEFVAAGGKYSIGDGGATPATPTIPLSNVQGDMDGDGKLTPNDAAIILRLCTEDGT